MINHATHHITIRERTPVDIDVTLDSESTAEGSAAFQQTSSDLEKALRRMLVGLATPKPQEGETPGASAA